MTRKSSLPLTAATLAGKNGDRTATPSPGRGTVVRPPADPGRYDPALPLDKIDASPTNARGDDEDDQAELRELADTILDVGVLEAIVVRPKKRYGPNDPVDRYELVAGERRWRAAKMAGLTTIPATVREFTDEQALVVQLIENLQRKNLYPLDESKQLLTLKLYGYTAEDIAGLIHKSRAYIYTALKRLDGPERARKAFKDGTMLVSVLDLICRMPSFALAESATQTILDQSIFAYKDAKELIERKYMVQLKGAPFDQRDTALVPEAGSCTACPKRAGNARDLYPDARADLCTDPACYRGKEAAHGQRILGQARADGKEILEHPVGVFSGIKGYEGRHLLTPGSGYMHADVLCDLVDGDKTWRQALGVKASEVVVVAVDPAGVVHELVQRDRARAVFKARGILRDGAAAAPVRKRDPFEVKVRDETRRRLVARAEESARKALGGARTLKPPRYMKPLVVMILEDLGAADVLERICERRQVEDLRSLVQEMNFPELGAILIEVMLGRRLAAAEGPPSAGTQEVLQALDLDAREAEQEVRDEWQGREKKKGAAKS